MERSSTGSGDNLLGFESFFDGQPLRLLVGVCAGFWPTALRDFGAISQMYGIHTRGSNEFKGGGP